LCIETIQSYPLSIANETKEKIKIHITYAMKSSICPSKEYIIDPLTKKVTDAGICCLTKIEIAGASGTLLGKQKTYIPTPTGFGMSCKPSSIVITSKQGDLLIIEG
jgi:hypothetical protein